MTIKAMTIAGSDSGGGAGIQADLKTFQELGVFGTSVITAITAQNTLGVTDVHPIPVLTIEEQFKAVITDIGADAVKTGMLYDKERIEAIADLVSRHQVTNLIVDPVMVTTTGSPLLKEDAQDTLIKKLFPLAILVTPNIPEAEAILSKKREDFDKLEDMAKALYHACGGVPVLLKGGHEARAEFMTDVLFTGQTSVLYTSPRIDTTHTHGTGCTYAAAITAFIAQGVKLESAIFKAKEFLHVAIEQAKPVGEGAGPVHHSAHRESSISDVNMEVLT
ncbi:bifunctional hydroxymethylpyrimidine kinase/phosphomethylpyrimidine kinase [Paenalkalicoccus suaedae]|uniref:Hydroxymethylpyrimidine/phosphomethylpyrimidine kinase n=1 Tax=Paenalkalicoccus suaedae TaxID=2592382 RepID=A0A859FBW0_9BACI|nr:bifunctional hydroxymethylpyrimidine kinase/phosphomethylpyrimidine kinase [Paenalkalicoccus suaedae]QKS70537.1 bifunctional hydroxymethylpyrimidine kinase/phosphomethylpyrimidine kinase [Paenalkalicoccus suaedae]